MRHATRILTIAVLLGALSGRVGAVTETYLFRDSFAPKEGAGNVLVPVSNTTGMILTSGTDFRNGSFVTETISASACASTPTIRAWSFPDEAGLRYDNATPTVITGSYTISMLMRYDPMDASWARLVDFSNSTLDTGIYKYGDGVDFYPVGSYAAGSFVQGQDVFVTITRDAGTKLVSLYINGVPSGTYTDTTDLYAPSATVVYFLMDNTTGAANITETDPGIIAYLQMRDTPITPEEVTASLASICQVVAEPTTTTTTMPPAGLVPGGGPTKSDCYVELGVVGIENPSERVKNNKIVLCTDGEACDTGPCGDRQCDVRLRVCINQPDPNLASCTPPSRLDRVTVKTQGKVKLDVGVPQLLAGPQCGAFFDGTIPVKVNKKGKVVGAGKAKIKIDARAPKGTKPRPDEDTITIECVPRTVPCPQ